MKTDKYPFLVAEVVEQRNLTCIIKLPNKNKFLVQVRRNVNLTDLKQGQQVLVERKHLEIIDLL